MKLKLTVAAMLVYVLALTVAVALMPAPARACYNTCQHIQCLLEDPIAFGYFRQTSFYVDDFVMLSYGPYDCAGYTGIVYGWCDEWYCGGGHCPTSNQTHSRNIPVAYKEKQSQTGAQPSTLPAPEESIVYIAIAKHKLVRIQVPPEELSETITFLRANPRTDRNELVKMVAQKFHVVSTKIVSKIG